MTALLRHTGSARAQITLVTAVLAVLAVLFAMPGAPLAAPGADDEGGTVALRKKLDSATRAYNNAKGRVDTSRKKQKKLDKEIKALKAKSDALYGQVGQMAAAVYKGSWAGSVTALMESGSPDELADGMTTVSYLATRDHKQIKAFTGAHDELAKKRYAVELEMRKQREQLKKMAKRKKEALKALIAAGGGDPTSGFYGGGPGAAPAPRNPDGSWPPEACSEPDPTTSGCLTPRTLHAYKQARNAGFTRYTSCHRSGGSGEHPKGRACDFAAFKDGFRNYAATGSDKQYGDNLAGWFVNNANRLGVMYVIWYRQSWSPGTGWTSYNGGGSPSGDHTNHVHVSIQ
ncbi:MAG: hypothetical protein GEU94_18840 [Micromonosporaceae bacterium]|nr:hypothetical protein [Micromonosporaceae bacterium]